MVAPWAFYEKIFSKLSERGRVSDSVGHFRGWIGNFGGNYVGGIQVLSGGYERNFDISNKLVSGAVQFTKSIGILI